MSSSHGTTTEFVTANDLEFEVLKRGSGDRLALLLHGFPDDAGSMVPLMEILADHGFTAVAPYTRGYGGTDLPPDDSYRIRSLAADAVALIEHYTDSEALLVGHDWGGTTGYRVAREYPDRLSKLVTLADPVNLYEGMVRHPLQLFRSWYMAFFQIPGVSERALRDEDFTMIERLWRDWSPGWEYPQRRLEAVKDTFRQPGTVEAALGYYRHLTEPTPIAQPPDESERSPIGVPTLVIAGENDGCIGVELFRELNETTGAVDRVEILDDVGHFMHQEAPETVGRLVVDFASDPS